MRENSFQSLYKTSIPIIDRLIQHWCVQLPLVKVKELLTIEGKESVGLNLIGNVYINIRILEIILFDCINLLFC